MQVSYGMNRRVLVASVIFLLSVLFLTRLDYLVNSRLYGYGLQFSSEWYSEYNLLYGIAWQLVIILLFLWVKSWKFLAATEAFVLSATQDLIFYAVWCGEFPPPNVPWSWMFIYEVLGFWNTTAQIMLSIVVNVAVVFALFLYKQE